MIDQIIKTAKEGCFDLVVIGARGLSKVEEIMLGSVSCGVAGKSAMPSYSSEMIFYNFLQFLILKLKYFLET